MLLSNPRLAIACFFFAGGIGLGTWAASLPALVVGFGLEERQLGLILLGFAVGAIASMTAMGRTIVAHGGRTVAWLSTALFGLFMLAIPHPSEVWMFAVVVALTGAAFGCLDVSMNTAASDLERGRGQRLMSSFHAAFSLGNLAGAVICGQVLRSGADVRLCFAVSGVAIVSMAFLTRVSAGFGRELPVPHAPSSNAGDVATAPPGGGPKIVLLLGGMAFLVFFAEGAILDWIALLLVTQNGFDPGTAAYAFAVFAATMAIGRGLGDIAIERMGPVIVMRAGMLGVAATFSLILAGAPAPLVFACLAVTGLGIANVVPCIFSAAGRAGGPAAGTAMSRVTGMGYSGLLVGPAMIGFLAHETSLPTSLSIIIVFAIALMILAPAVSDRHVAVAHHRREQGT